MTTVFFEAEVGAKIRSLVYYIELVPYDDQSSVMKIVPLEEFLPSFKDRIHDVEFVAYSYHDMLLVMPFSGQGPPDVNVEGSTQNYRFNWRLK